MEITQKVENYVVVTNGIINVFESSEALLELQGGENLTMKFKFGVDNKNPHPHFYKEVDEDTLIWTIFNLKFDNSSIGISKPIEIGEYSDNNKMYFTCHVKAVNIENGIFFIIYTFWKKED